MPTTFEYKEGKLDQKSGTPVEGVNQAQEATSTNNENITWKDLDTSKFPGGVPKGLDTATMKELAVLQAKAAKGQKTEEPTAELQPVGTPKPIETQEGVSVSPEPVTSQDIAETKGIGSNVMESAAYMDAMSKIEQMAEEKDMKVEEIVQLMNKQSEIKQSAFDKYYGEGSKLATFYEPALTMVEQQILDVEGLLDTLEEDIVDSTKDVGLTTSQLNLIKGKKGGELTKQLSQLSRTQESLMAGLDVTLLLSEKGFESEVGAYKDQIDAAIFGLENSGMPQEQIDLMKMGLQQQYQQDLITVYEMKDIAAEVRAQQQYEENMSVQEKKDKDAAFEGAVTEITNMVLSAGVVPSESFNKMVKDLQQMYAEGKTLSEIQIAAIQTIGMNPQVKEYINSAFSKAKSSTYTGSESGTDFPECDPTSSSYSETLCAALTGATPKSGDTDNDIDDEAFKDWLGAFAKAAQVSAIVGTQGVK